MTRSFHPRRMLGAAMLPVLLLSACAANTPTAPTGDEPIEIAFLNSSSANTYLAAARTAMEAIADEENVTITEFDAKFAPGVQSGQIQDVIASGRYDGLILAANDGAALAPDVEDALAAGLQVVLVNQTVGDDFTTADPQIEGVAGSVLAPPAVTGERLGDLTVSACADLDPCRVVYLYGIKGGAYDSPVREGFDQQIASNPAIEVVAEGEGGFGGTDQPLQTTQDIIQAHPQFEVLVASGDQNARGGLLAITDAGLTGVKIVGVGGSTPAIDGVKDGSWYGTVALAPADEGKFAMLAMIDAVRDGTKTGGIDPVADLPDNGLITADNVDRFTAQWEG